MKSYYQKSDSDSNFFIMYCIKLPLFVGVLAYFFWDVPIVKILAGVCLVIASAAYAMIQICIMISKMLLGIPI